MGRRKVMMQPTLAGFMKRPRIEEISQPIAIKKIKKLKKNGIQPATLLRRRIFTWDELWFKRISSSLNH
jgi:hypothetical protein